MENVDGYTLSREDDKVVLVFSNIEGECEAYAFNLEDAEKIMLGFAEVLQ